MQPLSRRIGTWIEPPLVVGYSIPAVSLTLTAGVPITVPLFLPSMAMTLTAVAPAWQASCTVPAIALNLTAQAPAWRVSVRVPAASVTLTAMAPLSASVTVTAITITVTVEAPAPEVYFDIANPGLVRVLYRCYLTGSPDGLADLEIPISSFSARRRTDYDTWVSVTAPNPDLDGIEARPNGQIVVYGGLVSGETETLTELLRADFDEFRYDTGPYSGSATLAGYAAETARDPLTRDLTGVSYLNSNDGVKRYRCDVDRYLAPGDTAIYGDDSITIESISYTVGTNQAWMEVQEIAA